MYQIHDYIVTSSGGICQIADICTSPFENMPTEGLYYIMHSLHDRNSTICIPVDSDKIFTRPVMSREQATELLDRVEQTEPIAESNSKLLREKYLTALKSYDPTEWVRVVKTVYQRTHTQQSRSGRVSDTERSYAESARRYLYTELSLALEIPEESVEDYITRYVEGEKVV